MKLIGILLSVLAAARLLAQGTAGTDGSRDGDLEALRAELRALRERTEALERRIQEFERSRMAPTPGIREAPPSPKPGSDPDPGPAEPVAQAGAGAQSFLRAGQAYMNLSLSALVDAGWSSTPDVAQLQRGGHDPVQRGFSLPSTELALDGAVDPYFKGFANMVLKLDEENETEFELEEAYLLSSSLPANLQLKAGQIQAELGRHNPQHAHQWAFVDQPLVLNRLFGPDGLRNPGARLSWLMPAPFYSELFLTVLNGNGETAYSFRNAGEERIHGRATVDRDLRGPGDLLFVPRWAASMDVTENQTVYFGASGAFGPNSTGSDQRTEIYGIDGYWKWRSPSAVKGFPFVAAQSEVLFRRFDAGADREAAPPLPQETLDDWGFYLQALWGFKPLWIAGLRGEFVSGDSGIFDRDDPLRADRARVAPNLTWHPTEFSKIRLQYNYDQAQDFGDEHAVWLQLEYLLGAHAAHKF